MAKHMFQERNRGANKKMVFKIPINRLNIKRQGLALKEKIMLWEKVYINQKVVNLSNKK